MPTKPRQKCFVDRNVQGLLVTRVLMYWFLFMVGMFCLLIAFPLMASMMVPSPGAPTTLQVITQTWRMFWPAIFASALLLPLLLLDVIRVSHRFVGPVNRLRVAMKDLADGKAVTPVKFRYADFWSDVADEFNRVAERLQPSNSDRFS